MINGDAKVHSEMSATREAHKVIGGHYASPDLGLPFHGYIAEVRRTTMRARVRKTRLPAPARE